MRALHRTPPRDRDTLWLWLWFSTRPTPVPYLATATRTHKPCMLLACLGRLVCLLAPGHAARRAGENAELRIATTSPVSPHTQPAPACPTTPSPSIPGQTHIKIPGIVQIKIYCLLPRFRVGLLYQGIRCRRRRSCLRSYQPQTTRPTVHTPILARMTVFGSLHQILRRILRRRTIGAAIS